MRTCKTCGRVFELPLTKIGRIQRQNLPKRMEAKTIEALMDYCSKHQSEATRAEALSNPEPIFENPAVFGPKGEYPLIGKQSAFERATFDKAALGEGEKDVEATKAWRAKVEAPIDTSKPTKYLSKTPGTCKFHSCQMPIENRRRGQLYCKEHRAMIQSRKLALMTAEGNIRRTVIKGLMERDDFKGMNYEEVAQFVAIYLPPDMIASPSVYGSQCPNLGCNGEKLQVERKDFKFCPKCRKFYYWRHHLGTKTSVQRKGKAWYSEKSSLKGTRAAKDFFESPTAGGTLPSKVVNVEKKWCDQCQAEKDFRLEHNQRPPRRTSWICQGCGLAYKPLPRLIVPKVMKQSQSRDFGKEMAHFDPEDLNWEFLNWGAGSPTKRRQIGTTPQGNPIYLMVWDQKVTPLDS